MLFDKNFTKLKRLKTNFFYNSNLILQKFTYKFYKCFHCLKYIQYFQIIFSTFSLKKIILRNCMKYQKRIGINDESAAKNLQEKRLLDNYISLLSAHPINLHP